MLDRRTILLAAQLGLLVACENGGVVNPTGE